MSEELAEWRVVSDRGAAEASESGPPFAHAPSAESESASTATKGKWAVYTLEDVAKHNHKDDCWIVVDDVVYDMTPHVRHHEGWSGSGKISTLIAILAAMGLDCTEDFHDSHPPGSPGLAQLKAFQVGVLDKPNRPPGGRWIRFMTWEDLVASGRLGSGAEVLL
jgi:predicted heme/steroid binding protein